MKSESGLSLIEVLISMAIFAIFVLGMVYTFIGSASRVTEDNQLLAMRVAGTSVLALLSTSQNPNQWNGAAFTGSSVTGVPSACTALDASTLSNIQADMGLAANGAEIQLAVTPDNGVTCPCAVTESYSWKGGSWSILSQVQY